MFTLELSAAGRDVQIVTAARPVAMLVGGVGTVEPAGDRRPARR
jgi:hypothetical protein